MITGITPEKNVRKILDTTGLYWLVNRPLLTGSLRIGSDLPNYLFQFSLCAIYAYYFSLKPPFCYQN